MSFQVKNNIKDWINENVSAIFYDDSGRWFNPVKFASSRGIKVMQGTFEDDTISGSIVKGGDNQYTIYINNEDGSNRQRFTIAHELGHYISDMCGSHSAEVFNTQKGFTDMKLNRSGEISDVEREANEIAGMLLMPEEAVNEFVDNFISEKGDLDGLGDSLSCEFGVSTQAAYVRLINLGIISASSVYGRS